MVEKYEGDKNELQKGVDQIFNGYKSLLLNLNQKKGLPNLGLYSLSSHIVVDISERLHKDKARFTYFHEGIDIPDDYKVGGYLTYWIAKLKPVSLNDDNAGFSRVELSLNEYLALYVGFTRANQNNRLTMEMKTFNDIAYNLRYRHFSGDDLAIILSLLGK